MSTLTELKASVDESIKLTRKMLDTNDGHESRIKALEKQGLGTAELKEEVQKMATGNAKAIDDIKALTEKLREELNERQDEFEEQHSKAFGRYVGGDGASVDVSAPVLKALPQGPWDDVTRKVRATIEEAKAFLYPTKAVATKVVTALSASGGDLHIPQYEPEIIRPGEQQTTLLDLLPASMTTSPIIYWVIEVLGSRTDSTAIQSLDFTGTDQGIALGESDFVFDQKSAEVRTYGHTAKVATQMLEDVSQVRGYMENIMRYLVRLNLESQILSGNGLGKNFNGIKNQATAYDVTLDNTLAVSALQNLDVLRLAILQCSLTFFPATGTILHPMEATGLELLKDGQERYLFVNNPNSGQNVRPWGVPLVPTTQQPQDDFTVGAFNYVEVVIRKAIEVLISTENEDDFKKNLATIRAYGRGGLKVYQPGAIIDGDFTTAKAP